MSGSLQSKSWPYLPDCTLRQRDLALRRERLQMVKAAWLEVIPRSRYRSELNPKEREWRSCRATTAVT